MQFLFIFGETAVVVGLVFIEDGFQELNHLTHAALTGRGNGVDERHQICPNKSAHIEAAETIKEGRDDGEERQNEEVGLRRIACNLNHIHNDWRQTVGIELIGDGGQNGLFVDVYLANVICGGSRCFPHGVDIFPHRVDRFSHVFDIFPRIPILGFYAFWGKLVSGMVCLRHVDACLFCQMKERADVYFRTSIVVAQTTVVLAVGLVSGIVRVELRNRVKQRSSHLRKGLSEGEANSQPVGVMCCDVDVEMPQFLYDVFRLRQQLR